MILMNKLEYKSFSLIEKSSFSEEGTFEGYACTWGDVDLDGDIIKEGCFSDCLLEGNTFPLLQQHNHAELLGVVHMHPDTKGLRTKGELNPDVQRAQEMHSLIKQKAISKMSVGFYPTATPIHTKQKGKSVRVFTKANLIECSLVVCPTNPRASIEFSTVKEFQGCTIKTMDDVVSVLRELGLDPNTYEQVIQVIKTSAVQEYNLIQLKQFLTQMK